MALPGPDCRSLDLGARRAAWTPQFFTRSINPRGLMKFAGMNEQHMGLKQLKIGRPRSQKVDAILKNGLFIYLFIFILFYFFFYFYLFFFTG